MRTWVMTMGSSAALLCKNIQTVKVYNIISTKFQFEHTATQMSTVDAQLV